MYEKTPFVGIYLGILSLAQNCDKGGDIILPSKLKRILEKRGSNEIYLAPRGDPEQIPERPKWLEDLLSYNNIPRWLELTDKVSSDFDRYHHFEIDKYGRILFAKSLMERLGLEKDVTFAFSDNQILLSSHPDLEDTGGCIVEVLPKPYKTYIQLTEEAVKALKPKNGQVFIKPCFDPSREKDRQKFIEITAKPTFPKTAYFPRSIKKRMRIAVPPEMLKEYKITKRGVVCVADGCLELHPDKKREDIINRKIAMGRQLTLPSRVRKLLQKEEGQNTVFLRANESLPPYDGFHFEIREFNPAKLQPGTYTTIGPEGRFSLQKEDLETSFFLKHTVFIGRGDHIELRIP